MSLDPNVFRAAFADFQNLITARDGGHRSVIFHEGFGCRSGGVQGTTVIPEPGPEPPPAEPGRLGEHVAHHRH